MKDRRLLSVVSIVLSAMLFIACTPINVSDISEPVESIPSIVPTISKKEKEVQNLSVTIEPTISEEITPEPSIDTEDVTIPEQSEEVEVQQTIETIETTLAAEPKAEQGKQSVVTTAPASAGSKSNSGFEGTIIKDGVTTIYTSEEEFNKALEELFSFSGTGTSDPFDYWGEPLGEDHIPSWIDTPPATPTPTPTPTPCINHEWQYGNYYLIECHEICDDGFSIDVLGYEEYDRLLDENKVSGCWADQDVKVCTFDYRFCLHCGIFQYDNIVVGVVNTLPMAGDVLCSPIYQYHLDHIAYMRENPYT